MAQAGLDKSIVVEKAAQLANQIGLDNIQLKTLAESLNVQSPSLYNHIKGLDALYRELMLYGWRHMEERRIEAVDSASGYAAWEAICRAFYAYATENPGVFSAMLWYNKYRDDEAQKVTERLFSTCFQITATLGISEKNCNHLIRTFRSFLEGFCLLVNNHSFDHTLPVEDSFSLSLKVLIAGMKELEEPCHETMKGSSLYHSSCGGNCMYERMLNKQEEPTIAQMTAYCGACAELFTRLNEWLSGIFGTAQAVTFPYGNQYGWGIAHRKNKKLICHVFPEENAFTVMMRLSNKQFDSVYGKVQTGTQEQIEHKYPCGDGGWLHYRVTCREQLDDIQTLLTVKCT